MKYQVTYKIFATPELAQEARLGLEDHNRENPQYPPLPFVETNDVSIFADNRAEMLTRMKELYNVDESRVVSVEVLLDDSRELVLDTELLRLADKQPCCARYDWTTDEVLAYARDAIAAHVAGMAAASGTESQGK